MALPLCCPVSGLRIPCLPLCRSTPKTSLDYRKSLQVSVPLEDFPGNNLLLLSESENKISHGLCSVTSTRKLQELFTKEASWAMHSASLSVLSWTILISSLPVWLATVKPKVVPLRRMCLAICISYYADNVEFESAWHGFKYIDPAESGAVLPIVHVNGFKISERTIYGTMDNKEIIALFTYAPYTFPTDTLTYIYALKVDTGIKSASSKIFRTSIKISPAPWSGHSQRSRRSKRPRGVVSQSSSLGGPLSSCVHPRLALPRIASLEPMLIVSLLTRACLDLKSSVAISSRGHSILIKSHSQPQRPTK